MAGAHFGLQDFAGLLAVLAGLGSERLVRSWSSRRQLIAAAVCSAALLAEFAMPVDARPFTIDTAAVDHWLDTQPKPFASDPCKETAAGCPAAVHVAPRGRGAGR